MEDTILLHYPAVPVCEQLPSVGGIVRIRAPDDGKTYDPTSRKGRALLVVAVRRGEVDLRDWSAADLARLFSASPRSVSEALKLTSQELQDVANERRPLFQHQPAPTPMTLAEQVKRGVDEIGFSGVLTELGEIMKVELGASRVRFEIAKIKSTEAKAA